MLIWKKLAEKFGLKLMGELIQIISADIAKAGADTFVAGSAIFGAGQRHDPNRYDTIVKSLRESLSKA